ncbi:MAG: hypothetical protein JO056_02635 [Alphaproteobacteria bacterium]|jgi:hypothetical protein|nr:hypothetical protein [Alphaproteobacteria bacterium]
MPKFRASSTTIVAAMSAALLSTTALASKGHLTPLPGQAKHSDAANVSQGKGLAPKIKSGVWSALKNMPAFSSFPDTALVLTDGTVVMHDGCTSDWFRLTPDSKGSYINGAWKKTASMSSDYKPLYFASQVLNDGRMIINGGEYNSCSAVWTTKGALYDPAKDSWSSVSPPSGWSTIGDATSIVFADGTYVLTNCCSSDYALATIGGSVSWTVKTGAQTGKGDSNNEEGWTTLPNNTILTVDANRNLGAGKNNVEILNPSTNKWSQAGTTCSAVVDAGSHEIGPAPLLPTGFVFQAGGTTNNNVYDPVADSWKCSVAFAGGLDSSDGPAVVLPNGHALFQVSPGVFQTPSHFVEVEVKSMSKVTAKQVAEPASAANQSSYEGRLVLLPTGQAFWTSDVGDIRIYTPKGHAKAAWKPTITNVPATVARGSSNNVVQGTTFNGLSEGGYYGDDGQMSTNFPLVRITNNGSGTVCYAKTHDFSSRGVSHIGDAGSAKFDVPNSCDKGASKLEVVVNGIASVPSSVTVN